MKLNKLYIKNGLNLEYPNRKILIKKLKQTKNSKQQLATLFWGFFKKFIENLKLLEALNQILNY